MTVHKLEGSLLRTSVTVILLTALISVTLIACYAFYSWLFGLLP